MAYPTPQKASNLGVSEALLRGFITPADAIGHNVPVATGKRAGSRRGAKAKPTFNGAALALAVGITSCLISWGYLVYLAIDFGTAARGGDSTGWAFLALCAVGAVACLFAGLLLTTRLLRSLGITSAPDEPAPTRESPAANAPPQPPAPRQPGGRRAAR